MDSQLTAALKAVGVRCGDGSLIPQLAAAGSTHGLSAKQVSSKLSAYLLNQGLGGRELSGASVEHFVAALHRECNKENSAARATPLAAGTKWDGSRESWGGLTDTLGAGLKPDQQGPPITPLAGRTSSPLNRAAAAAAGGTPVTPQSAPRSAFKSRTNRGQVVSSLNAHLPKACVQQARTIHPEPQGVQLPGRYLYGLERLEDKVAAVNARISAWRSWLAAAVAADGSGEQQQLEVAPVGVPVQDDAYFVGRIVCEVEGGALNDTAVVLEGDTSSSEGRRAALDLSSLPTYRLFPGQVVAVRGVNPSGSRILAKQLWSHLPPPALPGPLLEGDAMQLDGAEAAGVGASGGLSAVVAAGPFCLADDLAYDPLQELLQTLKAGGPPNLLVLLGPFVDADAPLIAGGMISVTFQQLFQSQVLERLADWQRSLAAPCQVVLLPAVRDAFHHPTLPQPAIDLQQQQQDQHMTSLQNPCSFSAGPALLAAATSDVLRHLSSTELARTEPGAPADRLAALSSHVLGQRRFYPLYPAPIGTCLDLTGDAALALQRLPDLLLLPSDLAPFAKLVPTPPGSREGGGFAAGSSVAAGAPQVVVINPGRLAKGGSGGTYAAVTIAESAGPVASRCRVDIVRV